MASQYQHRAYDPAGEDYVYWLSDLEYDSLGTDYVGPPDFNTLTGVAVIKEYETAESVDGLVIVKVEELPPGELVTFEAI